MKIKFLGTGASEGIPAMFCDCRLCREAREKKEFHTRSQLLIGDDLLVDFPPDTYFHALAHGVDLGKIENVLVTHNHSDHFYAQDFWLRGQWSSFCMKAKFLTVYGNDRVHEIFRRDTAGLNSSAEKTGNFCGYETFGNGTRFKPVHTFEKFRAGEYTVTALPAVHIAGEECFNYLVEQDGKTVLYATDTGYPKREYFEYLAKNGVRLDAFISDATYGNADCADNGHMTFNKCERFKKELEEIKAVHSGTKCFLTHVFHGAAETLDGLRKSAPSGYLLVADGYELCI